MKNWRNSFVTIAVLLLCGCTFLSGLAPAVDEWKLQTEKEGIQVYTHWKMPERGTRVREMKGVVSVKTPWPAVLAILQEGERRADWMDQVTDAYHFEMAEEKDQWYTYTRFALPWPVRDQDMVTRHHLPVNPQTGKAVILVQSEGEGIPPVAGVKRLERVEACWRLTTPSPGVTRIEYQIVSYNKPLFPRWITDPLVQASLI